MKRIVLYDIPANLKEFHHIKFDHEKNEYWVYGHHYLDGVRHPFMFRIKSNAIFETYHEDYDIIDIRTKNVIFTLYPLSIGIHLIDD